MARCFWRAAGPGRGAATSPTCTDAGTSPGCDENWCRIWSAASSIRALADFHLLGNSVLFLLSPWAVYMVREASEESTQGHAIFHLRQEPLAGGGCRRLHLICGESLFSELAMFLKMGTTALVVCLIENGVRPGDRVQLHDPVNALRRFARNPVCRATATLADGRPDGLPNSTSLPPMCRNTLACSLDALVGGGRLPSVPGSDRAARRRSAVFYGQPFWTGASNTPCSPTAWRGLTLECAARWTQILLRRQRLRAASLRQRELRGTDQLLPAQALTPQDGLVEQMVRRAGLDWEQLPPLLEVRQELFEIDWRCGQLVRQFAPERVRYRCERTAVFDMEKSQVMNLSDPFATDAGWESCSELPHLGRFCEEHSQRLERAIFLLLSGSVC